MTPTLSSRIRSCGTLLIDAEIIGAVTQLLIINRLAGAVVAKHLLDLGGGEVAHHHFVDLHGGRDFADPQAGGEFQGEEAVGGGFAHADAQLLLEGVEHVFGAVDVAGRRFAHAHDVFAFGLPGVHGVEAHHPEDFAPLDIEAEGDALLDLGRQVTHRLLNFLQDRHQGAGLVFMAGDDGIDLSQGFRA